MRCAEEEEKTAKEEGRTVKQYAHNTNYKGNWNSKKELPNLLEENEGAAGYEEIVVDQVWDTDIIDELNEVVKANGEDCELGKIKRDLVFR